MLFRPSSVANANSVALLLSPSVVVGLGAGQNAVYSDLPVPVPVIFEGKLPLKLAGVTLAHSSSMAAIRWRSCRSKTNWPLRSTNSNTPTTLRSAIWKNNDSGNCCRKSYSGTPSATNQPSSVLRQRPALCQGNFGAPWPPKWTPQITTRNF